MACIRIVHSLLCCLLLNRVDSQSLFIEIYDTGGSEQAYSVAQATDDGFVVCGYSDGVLNGTEYIYLMKVDGTGSLLWQKVYPTATAARGRSVCTLNDGGFILSGSPLYTVPDSLTLVRADASGSEIWVKRYQFNGASTGAYDAKPTSDGGFIFCGANTTYVSGGFLNDVVVGKTDYDGNLEWHKLIDIGPWEVGLDVFEHPDGGYLVGGISKGNPMDNILLIRLNENGDTVWVRESSPESDSALYEGMDLTSDGGCIVTGRSNSTFGPYDILLCKYDENGELQWSKMWSEPNTSQLGIQVKELSNSGFIMAATGSIIEPLSDPYPKLMRLNVVGELEWEMNYDIPGLLPIPSDMIIAHDGDFVVVGYVGPNGFDGPSDIFVMKTDSNVSGVGITEDLYHIAPINIFPNPTTGQSWAVISMELDDAAWLRISDPQGREVRRYRLASGQRLQELDLNGLANGLYTCELLQGEYKLDVVKLTVQR
jgi:hypothetical protein